MLSFFTLLLEKKKKKNAWRKGRWILSVVAFSEKRREEKVKCMIYVELTAFFFFLLKRKKRVAILQLTDFWLRITS